MPDNTVWAGADYLLLGGNFNRSSCVAVLFEHAENYIETKRHKSGSKPAHKRRHMRPAKTKIQARNDEQCDEKQTGQALNCLLRFSSFGDWSGLDTTS